MTPSHGLAQDVLGRNIVDQLRDVAGAQQHALAVGEARIGGVLHGLQVGRGVLDLLDRIGQTRPLLRDVAEDLLGVRIVERLDVELGRAVEEARHDRAVESRVAREAVGRSLRIGAAGENLGDAAAHAVGELHLARGDVDLRGARVLLGQDVDDLVHARVQRRELVGEVLRAGRSAEDERLVVDDLRRVGLQRRPRLGQLFELGAHARLVLVAGHALLVAFIEKAHELIDAVARAFELLERELVAGSRFGRVFRECLREHLDLRGVRLRLAVLLADEIQITEVEDREHEEQAQDHEQCRVRAPAPLSAQCARSRAHAPPLCDSCRKAGRPPARAPTRKDPHRGSFRVGPSRRARVSTSCRRGFIRLFRVLANPFACEDWEATFMPIPAGIPRRAPAPPC